MGMGVPSYKMRALGEPRTLDLLSFGADGLNA
jgi:hypothetical protein